MQTRDVSAQTSRNWWIDAGLFLSAAIASMSGIYFLFLPVGGYQGGRNPWYGVEILFTRRTWDLIHTWAGVAMIAIAAIHMTTHWYWVVNMAKRLWSELTGKCGCMNARGRFNLIVNAVIGLSFLLAAISSLYFLLYPGGQGAATPAVLFNRRTWDLIHTWSGVVMIAAATLHFAIHWKWVVKVARNMHGASTNPKPQLVSSRSSKTPVS